MSLAKQESNGKKGERRTEAILLDKFWVLKRSVDIEGADFLVQIPSDSLEELLDAKKKIQVFGIIQAKFFEGNNQVKILKKYVENDNGNPRTEFFAFLHTDDEEGENVHYFFTAKDIQDEFYLNKKKTHYCFKLTVNRKYEKYRNLPKRNILNKIEMGILETEKIRNKEFIKIYIKETQNIKYIRDKCIVYEDVDYIHTIKEENGIVTTTKKSKVTGAEAIVGQELGNLDNIDYDPSTGTTRYK